MKKNLRIKTIGTILTIALVAVGTTACGTSKTSNASISDTVSVEAAAAQLSTEVLNIEGAFGTAKLEKAVATADSIKSEKEEEIKKQEEADKAAKKATQTTKKVKATSNDDNNDNVSAGERPSVGGLSVSGILQLVNWERNNAGLGSLSLDGTLSQMAAVRAQEIGTTWSHTRPDGTDVTALARDYGYSYSIIGENLARGQKSSEQAVNQWMNSSGHRANIMGHYSRTGIAIAVVEGKNCIVQLFAN